MFVPHDRCARVFGGQRIATRNNDGSFVYLHSDHLGSVVAETLGTTAHLRVDQSDVLLGGIGADFGWCLRNLANMSNLSSSLYEHLRYQP